MNKDIIRIISLGGFNTVTQNMYLYHFLPQGKEEESQILIVDSGVGFPEGDLLGVDLVIPDFSYLKKREDKIAGVLLTHGHEDHIGSLPLFLTQFKKPFPVWAGRLAAAMAERKLVDFGIKKKIRVFGDDDQITLGKFRVEPIRVTHSVPDTYHFLINTPIGNFYHGADYKFDPTPVDGKPARLDKISQAGERGILALLSDCLGAEHKDYSPSEQDLADMFDDQIRRAKGRVFVTAISSNIYRWQQVITASVKYGRKIVVVGMSIDKNVQLARELNYLSFKDQHFVKPERMRNYPDNHLTILVAGSLGQTGSALNRIIAGKHKISIKPTDKVIFSSPDYVPGTSAAIYSHIDSLSKKGVEVVYGEIEGKLHVSGHGYQKEIALLISLTKPQWLIPIGANYRHMKQFSLLAQRMGIKEDRVIIPEEYAGLVFDQKGLKKETFPVPTKKVYVDGFGVGDVGQVVLRDRRQLSQDGMMVAIILIDSAQHLVSQPSIVSRGFVYLKENEGLIKALADETKTIFNRTKIRATSKEALKKSIQGELEKIVYKKTGRQPMVLPVLIQV